MLLVLFAFLAGIVTLLSPCILPLLPIILSNTVATGKLRPYGIVVGFITSFTFFTLFLTALVNQLHLPADLLRSIAIFIVGVFGLSLLFPAFQTFVEALFARLTPEKSANRSGFWGGIIMGLSLGLVWTPCVGPILASVIALAVTGHVTGQTVAITLAYSIGTSLPMLAIMIWGRGLVQKIPRPDRIQQVFGVLMLLTALALYFNLDRKFLPNFGSSLTQFESLVAPASNLSSAPEIIPGGQWFNSPPLTLASLKGKVVLVDFWTYTCINCIRTLPYVENWYKKYSDHGFVVIGVHTPEFPFEQLSTNVSKAIADFGITYPVVQDNAYATWNAFSNQYWPAEYLIGPDGQIIHTQFGEGDYDESEKAIQKALGLSMPIANPTYSIQTQTPELYIGLAKREPGFFQLLGNWTSQTDFATANAGSSLLLNFQAQKVFLVMSPTSSPVEVSVYLDGKFSKKLSVNADKLYTLINLDHMGKHVLKLDFPQGGVDLFSFTFG